MQVGTLWDLAFHYYLLHRRPTSHLVTCFDPGQTGHVLVTCFDFGQLVTCFDPGQLVTCFDPGQLVTCFDPGQTSHV